MRILFTFLLLFALNVGAAVNPIYVRSTDGNDAEDGSTWALAKATLDGALIDIAAGGTIYVSDNHAQTTNGSLILTSPGTAGAWVEIICVDDSSEPPTALSTNATITTTGTANLTFAGFATCRGVTFNVGTGNTSSQILFNNASPWAWTLENCALNEVTGLSSVRVIIGASGNGTEDGQLLTLINTSFSFGNAGQAIRLNGPLVWQGSGSTVVGSVPATLFINVANASSGRAKVVGVDLSALGSGKSLVDVSVDSFASYEFLNCKLGSSLSITTGTHAGPGGIAVDVVNSDSADTNYRFYHEDYQGVITSDIVNIRTNGAYDQLNRFSRKMVTSANASFKNPQYSHPIYFYNDRTNAAQTITLNVLSADFASNNSNTWIEVSYLGTAGFPMSQTVSNKVATLAAVAAIPTNTIAATMWVTNGIANPIAHQHAVTISPPIKQGLISVRLACSKPSVTNWIDCATFPGIRQYMSPTGMIINDSVTGSYSAGQ
jgi:hypothetical protein